MKERAVKESENDAQAQKKHQAVLDSVRVRIKAVEQALASMVPQLEHKKGNGEAKPKKAKSKRAKASKDAPVDSATPAAAASLPKDVH